MYYPTLVQMLEVELKYAVDSFVDIRTKLRQRNSEHITDSRQEDEYFNHPALDFAKRDLALRIRQVGDECWLTYKGPNTDQASGQRAKIRKELELKLDGVESARKLRDIFLACGFQPVAKVAKRREVHKLVMADASVEVCLDEVDGVGSFVEIELLIKNGPGTDANDGLGENAETAKQKLLSIAQSLGLSNPVVTTYLELKLQALNN